MVLLIFGYVELNTSASTGEMFKSAMVSHTDVCKYLIEFETIQARTERAVSDLVSKLFWLEEVFRVLPAKYDEIRLLKATVT